MAQTDDIKQRLDLVELVQQYVPLTQAGTNWKARCPFHQEKTASFLVSRDKQIWHCFGCGKGGDHFTFIQEIEGMEFPEALRFLAAKAGVTLREERREDTSARTRLLDLNALAAKAFHRILVEHPKAEAVRKYVEGRGLDTVTVDRFQIGYAPESWDGMSTFLSQKKFTDDELFQAGLTVKRDRGTGQYDRFRHRLMFPICDHLGRVVGFGGRALEPTQQPKYVNTPQTAIYNKSAVLYGLDKAKNAIKAAKCAVLVEGYMDVVSSHQAGVENVVAVSGTSLTREQLRLLKRFTDTVALSFDMDVAGRDAVVRGIVLAWEEGMNVKILTLPSGKDPDELLRTNPEAWKSALAAAEPFMEYAFRTATADRDLTRIEDKKAVAKELLKLIALLTDPIEQTHYLQQLASLLKVTEQALRTSLPAERSRLPVRKEMPPKNVAREKKSRSALLAERILALAAISEEHMVYLVDHTKPELFAQSGLQPLYNAMLTYYTKNHHFQPQDFLRVLGEHDPVLAQTAATLFLLSTSDLLPADVKQQRQELFESIAALKSLSVQHEVRRLQALLKDAERRGDAHEAAALTEQVNDFLKELPTTAS